MDNNPICPILGNHSNHLVNTDTNAALVTNLQAFMSHEAAKFNDNLYWQAIRPSESHPAYIFGSYLRAGIDSVTNHLWAIKQYFHSSPSVHKPELIEQNCYPKENKIPALKVFEQNAAKLMSNLADSSIISLTSQSDNFHYSNLNINKNSQFYIGSVSKHMTSYMLLCSLQNTFPEENFQNLLNKNLISLFPNSSLLKNINKKWLNEINLLDLLTHRSGLTDYISVYGDGSTPQPETLNKPIDSVTLLQAISFNPEKEYRYSNSNYLLLGKIIEELNQESFEQVFEKMVKIPAKMNSSSAPVAGNYFDFVTRDVYTQLVENLNEKAFLDMANAVGTGNVISTLSDLEKWGDYLFNHAPKNIVDTMLNNYGEDPDGDISNLGLSTMDSYLGPLIGHQGKLDSYNSFFCYAPDKKAFIISLSNSDDDANKLMNMMIEFLSQPKEAVLDIRQEKLLWAYNQNNNPQCLDSEMHSNRSNHPHCNHPK